MNFKKRIKGVVLGPWSRIYGSLRPVRPVPTIESLLARANGSRRVRRLRASDVAAIVQECRDASDGHWSCDHGGLVSNGYGWIARSTFALAATIDGQVYVGVTTINAKTEGTPGAGWWELLNLQRSRPETQMRKLRAWRDHNLNKTVVEVTPE